MQIGTNNFYCTSSDTDIHFNVKTNACITINIELSFSPQGIVCCPGCKERESLGDICIRKYYLLSFRHLWTKKVDPLIFQLNNANLAEQINKY